VNRLPMHIATAETHARGVVVASPRTCACAIHPHGLTPGISTPLLRIHGERTVKYLGCN
jgi:hypothetical protein